MIGAHYLRTANDIFRKRGFVELLRGSLLWWSERRHERWMGIDSGRQVRLDGLGITSADSEMYCATYYSAFFKAAKHLDEWAFEGSFVEYGAGLGRVVCCAATMPFKRSIGIELSTRLVLGARKNIELARKRFLCRDVQMLEMSATEWPIPDDVTVFHFFNPFKGQTLEVAILNIVESLRRSPRRAVIMFSSSWYLRSLMASKPDIIPRAWIKASSRVKWPIVRQMEDPDNRSYRLFFLDSRG